MRRLVVALSALVILGCCSGCAPETCQQQGFMMDTLIDLKAWGDGADAALADIMSETARLERVFSPSDQESEVNELNARAGDGFVEISGDLEALLEQALRLAQETDGAFDPTLGALVRLWDIGGDGGGRVPDAQEIAQAQACCGYERLQLCDADAAVRGAGAELEPDTVLDLGGVAKGYISDRAAAILRDAGVSNAAISLGGNIYACGEKQDGEPWYIGVRDPDGGQSDSLGVIRVWNMGEELAADWDGAPGVFIVTSGDYERFFELDGVRYHHILDPAAGAPARSGLRAVVVVGTCGCRADALSTALFVMGEERALQYWRDNMPEEELILICQDKRIVMTEGLEGRFVLTNEEYQCETARR